MFEITRSSLFKRLAAAIVFFHALMAVGTIGYLLIGGGRWSAFECLFMTVITVSTVGYGELPDMASVPGARVLTLVLITSGVGVLAYLQATITVLLVEGSSARHSKEGVCERRSKDCAITWW